jgi:hypothetical protein
MYYIHKHKIEILLYVLYIVSTTHNNQEDDYRRAYFEIISIGKNAY